MQTRWTAVTVACMAWSAGAAAAPLDQVACDSLKTERSTLIAAGIDDDVARGAEWAKVNNLGPDRLKQIARLIEVDEQLSFRCGEPVTARPAMKEPPKPVEAAATPGQKAGSGQAAALVSPSGEAVAPKKKKKPAASKTKPKDTAQGATAGNSLPSLSP